MTWAANGHLNLAVHEQGDPVGVCTVDAKLFPSTRTTTTGSWLGRRYQGRGLGREMRQAALHLIFAGLDAERAATRAWHDNTPSLRVTRSLPYTQDGASEEPRRDRVDTMLSFSMTVHGGRQFAGTTSSSPASQASATSSGSSLPG